MQKSASEQTLYPYILLNEDGSHAELTLSERKLIEKEFHPNDGARPYIATSYKKEHRRF